MHKRHRFRWWVTPACAVVFGRFPLLALYRMARPQRVALTRTRRGMSAYDLVVGADSFAGSGEQVTDAIRVYRAPTGRRRSIGDEAELTQLRETLGATSAHP